MKDNETEMRDEYDFSCAVKNPYIRAMRNGSNLVLIEPDLFKVFPDEAAVNEALRLLVKAGAQAIKLDLESESKAV